MTPTTNNSGLSCSSVKLTPEQVNYCTRQREALAIVWAFSRLREYLWGAPDILVQTDHANLKWLMEKEHTGRLARWQSELALYDFTIEYIKGKENTVPDSLSRIPRVKGSVGDGLDRFAMYTPTACLVGWTGNNDWLAEEHKPDFVRSLPAGMAYIATSAISWTRAPGYTYTPDTQE